MIKVRLSNISSNHTMLRTNRVEGVTESLPQKGSIFIMLAQALDPRFQLRRVNTSQIESVEVCEGKYIFKTSNSVYELEIL
jgi:hypothetical protein